MVEASGILSLRVVRLDNFVEDPCEEGVLSDFRYAAIANDIALMWGIDVLATLAGTHPTWEHLRDFPVEDRSAFFYRLWGR